MVYDICIFLLLFVCRNVVGTLHTYNLIFSISIAIKYEYGKHNEILAIKNTTATTHTPHIMWNEYAAVQPRHNMPWYALQCNAITPHNSTPVSQLAVKSTQLISTLVRMPASYDDCSQLQTPYCIYALHIIIYLYRIQRRGSSVGTWVVR